MFLILFLTDILVYICFSWSYVWHTSTTLFRNYFSRHASLYLSKNPSIQILGNEDLYQWQYCISWQKIQAKEVIVTASELHLEHISPFMKLRVDWAVLSAWTHSGFDSSWIQLENYLMCLSHSASDYCRWLFISKRKRHFLMAVCSLRFSSATLLKLICCPQRWCV